MDPARSESVFNILERYIVVDAAYNSSEHASTCAVGTCGGILRDLRQWAHSSDGSRICWLRGRAGTGKSTIARTIAQQYEDAYLLAFSFFFSRGNPDRSDITKFFPTFAYQLAGFLPSVRDPILDVVENSAIFHQTLRAQFTKLIVGPVMSCVDVLPPMIGVIDGLDEYTGQIPLMELIDVLVHDLPDRFPIRFLLTSRPKPRINEMFRTPMIQRETHHLMLEDYRSESDLLNFLSSELWEIQQKRNLPASWPSMADLEKLTRQSDGLYIYAASLIRFIDNAYHSPQQRLQEAVISHEGVDPLYEEVLREAQDYHGFEPVIGAIVFLYEPLNVNQLEQLLRLDVRLALGGCSSILTIPDQDNDCVRPYPTLRDFLTDHNRSRVHFLDPVKHHFLLMSSCMTYITSTFENNSGDVILLRYVCRYWCHHFRLGLSYEDGIDYIEPDFGSVVEGLMKKLQSRWLKNWILGLESLTSLKGVHEDLRSALKSLTVCWHYVKVLSSCTDICLTKEQSSEVTSLALGLQELSNAVDVSVFSRTWCEYQIYSPLASMYRMATGKALPRTTFVRL